MVDSKEKIIGSVSEKIIFIYLIVFPLGQLIRLKLKLFAVGVVFHPADFIVALSLPIYFFGFFNLPKIHKYISDFILSAIFSLMLSMAVFDHSYVFVGSLYLLRLISYFAFFILAWNFVADKKDKKILVFKSLIAVSVVVAVFGWIQYFWFPDLRFLKYIGWDDHLYRLVGTFLDPAFTSTILVFGFLATLTKFVFNKEKWLIPILLLFVVTISFTYARTSFLALVFGSAFLFIGKNRERIILLLIFLLLALLPFLPRPSSEGVKLERVHSVYAKYQNYKETVEIIKRHPLFGVGFNNICPSRVRYVGDAGYKSHSCSGSDSSLLLVIATTGVVGFLVFLNMAAKIIKRVESGVYGSCFKSCAVALFVQSLFVNSMFYPWVMGWMGLMLAISLRSQSKL